MTDARANLQLGCPAGIASFLRSYHLSLHIPSGPGRLQVVCPPGTVMSPKHTADYQEFVPAPRPIRRLRPLTAAIGGADCVVPTNFGRRF